MEVKGIDEKKVNWEKFHKYFREKYLSYWYYDNKRKEFHDLKLGHKSIEDHVQKFMELLRYMDYIREERVKIQTSLEVYLLVTRIGSSFPTRKLLKKPFVW